MPTTTETALAAIVNPYALQARATDNTIGQADPVAGDPTPDRPSAVTMNATGPQTEGIVVRASVQDAGNVGDASIIWWNETAGVADSYKRGQDVQNVTMGFEQVTWANTDIEANPHGLKLADDSEVIVYSSKPVAIWTLKAQVFDPATSTYSTVSISGTTGLGTSIDPRPALCLIQDAANKYATQILLCAYWSVNATAGSANISMVSSRDGGATWSSWARNVLPDAFDTGDYTLGRIRFVAVGTSLAMFVHTTEPITDGEQVWQYASGSNGARWTLISTIAAAGYPEVVATQTVGYVAWISSADEAAYIVPLADPFSPVDVASAVDLFQYTGAAVDSGAPSVFSFGTLAMTITPGGMIYAYNIRTVTNVKQGYAAQYNPATNTAQVLNSDSAGFVRLWFWDGLATSLNYPNAFTAIWWRGQVHIYTTFASSVATYDDKLCRLDIGGYSTLTLPCVGSDSTDNKRAAWSLTTIPTALASVYGYTVTGAGTESITANVGWDTFTTVANTRYAEINPTGTSGELWRLWKVKVSSGGGVTTRVIMCGLTWDDGAVSYSFEVRCSTTQIRFRDVFGAADGATATVGIGTGIYIFGVIGEDGTASVWYREISPLSDHYWVPLQLAYALVDGGIGTSVNVATHGNRASGTAVSQWVALAGCEQSAIGGAELASGLTLPTDLRGAVLAARPDYVSSGVSLGWTGGPAAVGDSWTIRGDAEHAYRLMLPVGDSLSTWNLRGGTAPSATAEAKEWRSTATTGLVWFEWPEDLDRLMEQGLAVQFEGLNAPTVEVIGYIKASATIVSLGTHDQRWTGLAMTLVGSTLTVDPGTTSTTTPYWQQNELAGGFVVLDGGVVRPIIGNSAGQVKASPATRQVVTVYLDPASITGAETAASTISVVAPRSTFLKFFGSGTKYSRLGLRWTAAPDIYGSYIRARIVAFGPITALAHAIQWGYVFGGEDPAAVATMTSGLRFGRRVRQAMRRTLDVNFAIPWNQTYLYSTTQGDPVSYKLTTLSGAVLTGTWGDAPNKLMGAWIGAGGTRNPVVFIPNFATGTGADASSLIGQNYVGFYGRMTEPKLTEANAYGAVSPVVAVGNVLFTFEL